MIVGFILPKGHFTDDRNSADTVDF